MAGPVTLLTPTEIAGPVTIEGPPIEIAGPVTIDDDPPTGIAGPVSTDGPLTITEPLYAGAALTTE